MAKDPLPYLKEKKFTLSEDFVRQLCLIIKEHIQLNYADEKVALITLAHDGIPPSHIIARELNIPLYVINSPLEHLDIADNTKKIMLDDIYDTGATYEKYKDIVHADEWIFLTAKQNIPEKAFCPCVFQTRAYIVYPWEKYDFLEK